MNNFPSPGAALLGRAVRERRLWLELDQGDLQMRGGPGPVTVRNIEKSKASPSSSTLRALNKALAWPDAMAQVLYGVAPLPNGIDTGSLFELAITHGYEAPVRPEPAPFELAMLEESARHAYDLVVDGRTEQAIDDFAVMARLVAAHLATKRARPANEENPDDRDAAPTTRAGGRPAPEERPYERGPIVGLLDGSTAGLLRDEPGAQVAPVDADGQGEDLASAVERLKGSRAKERKKETQG